MAGILYLGCGGCGNRVVEATAQITDKTIGLKNSYEYTFLNSNRVELFKNSHCTNGNSIVLSQNGAGQDKQIAKRLMQMEKSKILNFLNGKLEYIDRLVIVSSMSGGTGSTSIPIISKLAKKIKPSLEINVIAVSPDMDSTTTELENALTTYQDIIDLNDKGIICSTMIIDNNKMDSNEEEFNKKCMELVLQTYEVGSDSLDTTDLQKVSSARDYKIIIPLNAELGNIHTSIRYALDDSPFVLNSALSSDLRKIKSTHMAAVLKDYTKIDIRSEISATIFSKIETGDKNVIILSGMRMPNDHFNVLSDVLLDSKEEVIENIESDFRLNTPTIRPKEEPKQNSITEKEKLLSLLDDDDIF